MQRMSALANPTSIVGGRVKRARLHEAKWPTSRPDLKHVRTSRNQNRYRSILGRRRRRGRREAFSSSCDGFDYPGDRS